jgi:hypothetical protein
MVWVILLPSLSHTDATATGRRLAPIRLAPIDDEPSDLGCVGHHKTRDLACGSGGCGGAIAWAISSTRNVPELVAKAIKPDYAFGNHVAPARGPRPAYDWEMRLKNKWYNCDPYHFYFASNWLTILTDR